MRDHYWLLLIYREGLDGLELHMNERCLHCDNVIQDQLVFVSQVCIDGVEDGDIAGDSLRTEQESRNSFKGVGIVSHPKIVNLPLDALGIRLIPVDCERNAPDNSYRESLLC